MGNKPKYKIEPNTGKASNSQLYLTKEQARILVEAADKYGLEGELRKSFFAIPFVESGHSVKKDGVSVFTPNLQAKSTSKAKGPFQFLDETATELGLNNPFDFAESAEAGAKYMKKLFEIALERGELNPAAAASAYYNRGFGRGGLNANNYKNTAIPDETYNYLKNKAFNQDAITELVYNSLEQEVPEELQTSTNFVEYMPVNGVSKNDKTDKEVVKKDVAKFGNGKTSENIKSQAEIDRQQREIEEQLAIQKLNKQIDQENANRKFNPLDWRNTYQTDLSSHNNLEKIQRQNEMRATFQDGGNLNTDPSTNNNGSSYNYLNYKVPTKQQQVENSRIKNVSDIQRRIVESAWNRINNKNYFYLPENIANATRNETDKDGNPLHKIPENNTCIYGACGVMKDAGIDMPQFHRNTNFQNQFANYNFTKPSYKYSDLKPGSLVQHRYWNPDEEKYKEPTHAQIYLGKDEKTGELLFYDNYRGTALFENNKPKYNNNGLRRYSEDDIKERFNENPDQSSMQVYNYGANSTGYSINRARRLPTETEIDDKYSGDMYKIAVTTKDGKKYKYQQSISEDEKRRQKKKEKELIELMNNQKLDQKLRDTFLITQETLEELKPIIYGLIDQESDFGSPKKVGRLLKYKAEKVGNQSFSKGPASVKWEYLRDKAKNLISEDERRRIIPSNKLYDMENAYIGALDMLLQSGAAADNLVDRNIDLLDKHPWAPALYFYNGQGYSMLRGDANLSEDARLRMDKGSYPNKVFTNAERLKRYAIDEKVKPLTPEQQASLIKNLRSNVQRQFQKGGRLDTSDGQVSENAYSPSLKDGLGILNNTIAPIQALRDGNKSNNNQAIGSLIGSAADATLMAFGIPSMGLGQKAGSAIGGAIPSKKGNAEILGQFYNPQMKYGGFINNRLKKYQDGNTDPVKKTNDKKSTNENKSTVITQDLVTDRLKKYYDTDLKKLNTEEGQRRLALMNIDVGNRFRNDEDKVVQRPAKPTAPLYKFSDIKPDNLASVKPTLNRLKDVNVVAKDLSNVGANGYFNHEKELLAINNKAVLGNTPAHEMKHAITEGRENWIDKYLRDNIQFKDIDDPFTKYALQNADELSAYIRGARQDMLDLGIIDDIYQDITTEDIKKAYNKFNDEETGQINFQYSIDPNKEISSDDKKDIANQRNILQNQIRSFYPNNIRILEKKIKEANDFKLTLENNLLNEIGDPLTNREQIKKQQNLINEYSVQLSQKKLGLKEAEKRLKDLSSGSEYLIDKSKQRGKLFKVIKTDDRTLNAIRDAMNSLASNKVNENTRMAKRGGFISTEGYKKNSPDLNNDYNIIPSNNITMKDVEFPVLGIDDLGNSKVMYPNKDYKFKGNYVTEIPLRDRIKKYQDGGNIRYGSNDYRKAYNEGKITSYSPELDLHVGKDLPTSVTSDKAPFWLKAKREFEKNNPKPKNATEGPRKALGVKTAALIEWENKQNEYIVKQIEKKRKLNGRDVEKLNTLPFKEQQYLASSPKYQTSYYKDFVDGVKAVTSSLGYNPISRIADDKNLTNYEKKERLDRYLDNPTTAMLSEAAGILSPLTIPAKAVQSIYKNDYSIGDALSGTKNNAGLVEDIITDPFTYTGLGLGSKLTRPAIKSGAKRLNKFTKIDYNNLNKNHVADGFDKRMTKSLHDEWEDYFFSKKEFKDRLTYLLDHDPILLNNDRLKNKVTDFKFDYQEKYKKFPSVEQENKFKLDYLKNNREELIADEIKKAESRIESANILNKSNTVDEDYFEYGISPAFYSHRDNGIYVNPAFKKEADAIFSHEYGHLLSGGNETKTDYILKHIKPKQKEKKLIDFSKKSNRLKYDLDTQYHYNTRNEPTAFLRETRKHMLEDGLIKTKYQKLSEEDLKKAHDYYTKKNRGGIKVLKNNNNTSVVKRGRSFHALDLENTKDGYSLLKTAYNNLPTLTVPVLGGSLLLNENKNRLQKYQDGGEFYSSKYSPNINNSNKIYGTSYLPEAEVVFKPKTGAVRYIKDFKKKYPYSKEKYGSEEDYNKKLKEYVSAEVARDLGVNKRDVLKINTLPVLDQMYLQTNPKYQTSYGDDLVEALKTFGKSMKYSTNVAPGLVEKERIEQIKNAKYLTELEKWQKIQEYKKSPWASRFSDMSGILAPTAIPGKLIQSIYKEGYGPYNAISGEKVNSSMSEDVLTDPFFYKNVLKSAINASNAVNKGVSVNNALTRYTLPTATNESRKAMGNQLLYENPKENKYSVPNYQKGGKVKNNMKKAEIEGDEYVFNPEGVDQTTLKMLNNSGVDYASPVGFLAKGNSHEQGGIDVLGGKAYIASKYLGVNGKRASKNNPSVAKEMLKAGGEVLHNSSPSDKFSINEKFTPNAFKYIKNKMQKVADKAETNKQIEESIKEINSEIKQLKSMNPYSNYKTGGKIPQTYDPTRFRPQLGNQSMSNEIRNAYMYRKMGGTINNSNSPLNMTYDPDLLKYGGMMRKYQEGGMMGAENEMAEMMGGQEMMGQEGMGGMEQGSPLDGLPPEQQQQIMQLADAAAQGDQQAMQQLVEMVGEEAAQMILQQLAGGEGGQQPNPSNGAAMAAMGQGPSVQGQGMPMEDPAAMGMPPMMKYGGMTPRRILNKYY
jgi:hypothetical protein